jgi:hypothetical protein
MLNKDCFTSLSSSYRHGHSFAPGFIRFIPAVRKSNIGDPSLVQNHGLESS